MKILVAVADVDALVKDGSAIDDHARHNTTSVYTAAQIFPMLPEKLSTDLTSLNLERGAPRPSSSRWSSPRTARLQDSDVYRARVRNHAKLAYDSVAAWLEGNGTVPEAIAAVDGLAENLRLQDRVAQSMKNLRHVHGALTLETIEARPIFEGDALRDLRVEEPNRAKDLIEDFMIAANGVTARYLSSRGLPSIRRVVRTPERWDRIVEIAAEHKFTLPGDPDSEALEEFLTKEKAADPLRFPDLSLAVIKLLGAGEYTAELPGDAAPGHFGLAVKDYAHSTAPNRRYTDLITQRLLKAAIEGKPSPYSGDELVVLATHCSKARERRQQSRAAGRQVGGGASPASAGSGNSSMPSSPARPPKAPGCGSSRCLSTGSWLRGSRASTSATGSACELMSVDVERGFIDFKRVT